MPNWPSDQRLVGLQNSVPSVLPDADGSLWERLSYLATLGGNFGGTLPGVPRRLATPVNATISVNTALTERVNYFNDLTINNGIVLTGLAGGTIIFVENVLTFGNGSSQISVNELGAKGQNGFASSAGGPGYGGGAYGYNNTASGGSTLNRHNIATEILYNPAGASGNLQYFPVGIQSSMANGSAGSALGANGGNGSAWPFTDFSNPIAIPDNISLFGALMDLIIKRSEDHATYGSIGGGGGSAGAGGAGSTGGGTAGTIGTAGKSASNSGNTGGGGSGFGGGGAGGGGNTTGGTGGNGGRGGGIVLVIAKEIVASAGGLISANGGNGTNASGTNAGGGGGGGGGAAVCVYELLTGSAPTMQANGGTGGAKVGTGGNGGNGGAGMSKIFKVRSA